MMEAVETQESLLSLKEVRHPKENPLQARENHFMALVAASEVAARVFQQIVQDLTDAATDKSISSVHLATNELYIKTLI